MRGARSGLADQKPGLKTGQRPNSTAGLQPPNAATGQSGPWAPLWPWTLPAATTTEETPFRTHTHAHTLLWITCLSSKLRVTCPHLSGQEQGRKMWSLCVKGSQSGGSWNHPGPQTRRWLPMGHWQTPWVTTGSGKRKELLVHIAGKPNDNWFQVWLDPGVSAMYPGPDSGSSFFVLQFHLFWAGFTLRHPVSGAANWLLSPSLTPSQVPGQQGAGWMGGWGLFLSSHPELALIGLI